MTFGHQLSEGGGVVGVQRFQRFFNTVNLVDHMQSAQTDMGGKFVDVFAQVGRGNIAQALDVREPMLEQLNRFCAFFAPLVISCRGKIAALRRVNDDDTCFWRQLND